jgi:hypothetical protein
MLTLSCLRNSETKRGRKNSTRMRNSSGAETVALRGLRQKSWRWSVNVDGKQRRRQGYAAKAEAETGLDQFKAELAAPKAKPSITMGQAFEKYFEAKARKKSLAEDRRQAEHLKAAFGKDTNLGDITAARISDYKAKRLATKSRQTGTTLSAAAINRPLALVRHLLHLAHEEWGILDNIPIVRLERTSRRAGSGGWHPRKRTGCSRPPARAATPTWRTWSSCRCSQACGSPRRWS